jgi:hypothetical protein
LGVNLEPVLAKTDFKIKTLEPILAKTGFKIKTLEPIINNRF